MSWHSAPCARRARPACVRPGQRASKARRSTNYRLAPSSTRASHRHSVRHHQFQHVAAFQPPLSCQHHQRDAQGVGRRRQLARDFLFAINRVVYQLHAPAMRSASVIRTSHARPACRVGPDLVMHQSSASPSLTKPAIKLTPKSWAVRSGRVPTGQMR